MSDDAEDKTFDATPQKLKQARDEGDLAMSREGAAAGVMAAALLALLMMAVPISREISTILMPLLEQPEAFMNATTDGWQMAGRAVYSAMALAMLPVFGVLMLGAALPYVLQNAIVVSGKRLMPKFSNLSPGKGFKRIFSQRALFEFAKSLAKMITVGIACWMVAQPLYSQSVGLVSGDFGMLPGMLKSVLTSVLGVTVVVAIVIAGIDVPYQHWSYAKRMRMSLQDVRDEMRNSDGDPHVKMRQRRLRMERSRNRMMLDVPTATVVVTNPTHYAVALRYERGKDPAPVVVAKGADAIALRIREIAFQNQVPIIENPPLARALHKSAEVGDVIPQEYFEMAAKVISLVWSRSGRGTQPR